VVLVSLSDVSPIPAYLLDDTTLGGNYDTRRNPTHNRGMLAVQKELQDSQLRFDSSLDRIGQDISELRESTSELRESVTDLKEISQRHERRIEQLIGYSITGESDR
jgi:hypothetical protein